MGGVFAWIEKNTGLNVSNYDFDDGGNAVSYTNPVSGASTSVSDDDGKSSMNYAAEVGAYGLGTDDDGNITYFNLSGEESSIPASQTKDYTVKSGDTLGEIAGYNNTTVAEIAALNGIPLEDVNTVYVGQDLIIPKNTIDRKTTSIYAGLPSSVFASASEEATTEDDYFQKLEAAGEEDQSLLDEIAASDTTGIDVYEPTDATVAAVEDYYTTGAGAAGATQDVDYTETSSGEDFTVAAMADDEDISGGVQVFEEESAPELSAVEKILVERHNFIDNGDGTLTAPNGYFYDSETGGYTDTMEKTADLFPAEEEVVSPVEVNTFSDQEVVVPASDQTKYDDTILEEGTGGLSGIQTGDPMTPQLAAELGISYFEGDTIQSSDLIKLSDLGFDVSQADLTKAEAEVPLGVDVTVSTGDETAAGSGTVDQGAVDTSGMTTTEDALAELKRRVEEGIYTADVSVPEMTGTMALLQGQDLTDEEIAAFLPDYKFVKPDPGTQILGEASGGLGQEQLGALSLAIADGLGKLGIEYDSDLLATLSENLSSYGLGQIESGQEAQETAFEKLEEFDPEAAEAFSQPIVDPDTGEINLESLYTKGVYSAAPTVAGLSGLLVGLVPGAVTGAVMTAAELGSESFNQVYDQFLAANPGDEEGALAAARSANATAAALGVPIGAVSNIMLGSLAGGVGTGNLAQKTASIASTMLAGAVDEGLVEQSTIASVVDTQLGNEGNIYTTPEGVSFSWNASGDEGILGALTGGLVSLSAYNNAKAAGATDEQIASEIASTPAGQTVDLTGVTFDASSEVTPFTTASEALTSGDNVSIGTDNQGNITITNNETGAGATFTGDEVVAGTNLTGSETTVETLTGKETDVIEGAGADVTVNSSGGNIVLTNDQTGFSAVVGTGDNVNIVDATNAVQNSDVTATEAAGATVVDATASEALLGATDASSTVDLSFDGLSSADTTDATSSLEGTTTVVTGDGSTTTKTAGGIATLAGTDATTTSATDAAATSATDAAATSATDAAAATSTTTVGNATVDVVGNNTVVTSVDVNGNTTVDVTNNTTNQTTSNTVTAGNTAVVTNADVTVNVDATNATNTGVNTNVVENTVDVTDTTDVTDTDVVDVTDTTDVTDTVVDTSTDVVVAEPPELVESVPVVSKPRVPPKKKKEDKITPESAPGYESAIAGLGSLMRPTVAPYYQPQQTMDYSFYAPQPGVAQEVSRPTAVPLTSYLAPVTGDRRYGYGYIAPNAELDYLRRLAEIQGTGAERLPSEDLMNS